jgi:hypothetical protein
MHCIIHRGCRKLQTHSGVRENGSESPLFSDANFWGLTENFLYNIGLGEQCEIKPIHIWNLSFSETIPMYTHYYQLLSDLWQGCSNRSDIVMITTQLDCNNIVISWLYLVENRFFEIQKTIFHFAHQHQFTLSILTKWNLRKEGWGGGAVPINTVLL